MTNKELDTIIAEACGPILSPPSYSTSLDAMYEAEKTLGPARWPHDNDEWRDYKAELGRICERNDRVHATARQRAEAFARIKRPDLF